jgi:photosystem II stability/assembly factor-like uncharacterized protein
MCSVKQYVMLALGVLLMLQGAAQAASYVDVLELPARPSALAVYSPLQDVAQAGKRLVAVGQRGHILYSDDAGQNWQQAQVPVSVDLNAVYFPTPELGWAVGNDGVILHSRDAGVTWALQLDGRAIGRLLVEHYSSLASRDSEDERWAMLVEEGQRLDEQGADKPFLDVWFADEQRGYAVGVFNLIFLTVDGGRTWLPFQDRVDNPQGLHLNAINSTGDALYIVGEQGLLQKWDAILERFIALQTPYQGSFFGVTGKPGGEVLVYGLRGHAYLSRDGGYIWQTLTTDLQVSFTAATQDQQGRYLLFTQAGHKLLAEPGREALQVVPQASQSPVGAALLAANGQLILVGARGARALPVE